MNDRGAAQDDGQNDGQDDEHGRDGQDRREGSTVHKKALLRSWADRVVRYYASAALHLAGFTSAAGALATTPEIVDEETAGEARSRVNAALGALLAAREIPSTERALVATLAAREALALVEHREPSPVHLKSVVEALHAIAESRA